MKSLNLLSKTLPMMFVLIFALWGYELNRAQKVEPASSSAQADNRASLGVQTGHAMFVSAVQISADGKYLVTGSWDSTARLWEVETGNEIREFQTQGSFIFCVAITPDDQYVITGNDDGTVRLWETKTGKELRQFEGHSNTIGAIAVSADSKYVVTGSWDKTVRLWEIETGKEVQRLGNHSAQVDSVAISADDKYVLAGCQDGTVQLWEVATRNLVHRFKLNSKWVRAVAISNDGKYLAAGSDDNTTWVWETATGREISRLKGHSSGVISLTFFPDSKRIVSGSFDRTARVWDIVTGKELRKFKFDSDEVFAIGTTPDANYMAVSSVVHLVQLFETETGEEIKRFDGRSAEVSSVAFSTDDRYMLIGSWDATAHLWETATGKEVKRFEGHTQRVTSAVMSSDGKYAVTGSFDKTARLWDVATGKEVKRFEGHTETVVSVAISRDSKYVVTGSEDKTARLWDVVTGKEIRKFVGHTAQVLSVAISPDAKYVLTGSRDRTARLWEAATGREVRKFVGISDPKPAQIISPSGIEKTTLASAPTDALAVTFSPDGEHLLTGGDDGTTRLWETATGNLVRKFVGASSLVEGVAFSADGKYVLAGGADNIAYVWETTTGKEVQRFVHSDWVRSVAFSADGRFVLTGGQDSTSRVWEVATGKELCSLVSFNDGNWTVVTTEGRFDASDLEETNGLHWLIHDDPMRTYPIEIFMRDYYEPRLLSRILNGEKFQSARNISELNRAQPTVKILDGYLQDDPDLVTIRVEVARAKRESQRDKDGQPLETGVYDLRLFRDGHLVAQLPDDDAPSIPSAGAGSRAALAAWRAKSEVETDASGKRIVTFENIRLLRDGNSRVVFSAYAFNEDRVKSPTARQRFVLPAGLKPVRGRAYVVMFGVNAYEGAECLSLDYAVNDVRKMQETFVAKLKSSGQYEEVVDVPLISSYEGRPDGARVIAEQSAIKSNLKTVFDLLSGKQVDENLLKGIPNGARLKPVRPEDMVIIFFSGHGDSDAHGNFYIVPYDIGQTNLCGVIPPTDDDYNQVFIRSISSDELSLWLRHVDAGETVMIVDACYSAAAVQSDDFKPGPMGSRGLGQLAYDKRMRILVATQSDNVAREYRELNQSLLSYMLMKEGIEEGSADFNPTDQIVTIAEWLQYGVARVPVWYEERQKEKAKHSVPNSAESARQADKRLVHRDVIHPIQIPSLFDFTRGGRDSILFRKDAPVKQ